MAIKQVKSNVKQGNQLQPKGKLVPAKISGGVKQGKKKK